MPSDLPALSRAVALFKRPCREQWRCSTGTIESSGTIQPALSRAVAPFNRHYRERWHCSTGTIESSGAAQPALSRAVALFNRHYREQWRCSTGTIESSGTIQTALSRAVALFNPALSRAVALFNRHYRQQWHCSTRHYREQWHCSTGTIEGSGTIRSALSRAVALFNRHYRGVPHCSVLRSMVPVPHNLVKIALVAGRGTRREWSPDAQMTLYVVRLYCQTIVNVQRSLRWCSGYPRMMPDLILDFESQVGRTLGFICYNNTQRNQLLRAPSSADRRNSMSQMR